MSFKTLLEKTGYVIKVVETWQSLGVKELELLFELNFRPNDWWFFQSVFRVTYAYGLIYVEPRITLLSF